MNHQSNTGGMGVDVAINCERVRPERATFGLVIFDIHERTILPTEKHDVSALRGSVTVYCRIR